MVLFFRIYAPLKRQRHVSPPVSPDIQASDVIILPAITTNFRIPEINVDSVLDEVTGTGDNNDSYSASPNRRSSTISLSDVVVGVDRNTPSPDVGLLIPELDPVMAKTITGRRRSFAMTTKGQLVNEGDVIIGSQEDECFKNAEAISAVSKGYEWSIRGQDRYKHV